MNGRMITGMAVALILGLGLLGRALAHAELVASDPKDGARLDTPPAKITLVFDEEIDGAKSSFTITNATGAKVGEGKLDLNDLDRKTLSGSMDVRAGDGLYTVNWVAVTPDDNEQTEGTISFSVGAAQPQPTATIQPTATLRAPPTQPSTPRPTTATQPTVAPSNLPRTGEGVDRDAGWLLVLGLLALLSGLLALLRVQARSHG